MIVHIQRGHLCDPLHFDTARPSGAFIILMGRVAPFDAMPATQQLVTGSTQRCSECYWAGVLYKRFDDADETID